MEARQVTQRTGGRSARVHDAVHEAVADLLVERGADGVTVTEVATRSGVHPTSIYRRWGTLDALLLDVAVAQLEQDSPVPDTGTLRSDLLAYARQAARGVNRPDGLAFLRTVITATATATATPPDIAGGDGDPRAPFLAARGAQIQVMLDRAAIRGEVSLQYTDVLDAILAPIYLRSLFSVGGVTDTYLATLVDHLIARTPPAGPRR